MTPPRLISPALLRELPLPNYDERTDKFDRGKLLVVAGSTRLPGAAVLTARAALRTGCGAVRVAVPASVAAPVGVALPELLVVPLAEGDGQRAAEDLREHVAACRALVVGPGMDGGDETEALVCALLDEAAIPAVVDASALAACRSGSRGTAPRVYTPHPGEMDDLTGVPADAVAADRYETARRVARELGGTLVLKGHETLVAAPDGALYKNTRGGRELATAGSGDSLAGIIGSLLAQEVEPVAAAVWGVYLHALAGEAVATEIGPDGALASDVIERLPRVLSELRQRQARRRR